MGAQVMQLLSGGEDFRFVGFKGALAQVGKQCLLDSLLMGGNPALQRIQLLEAEIQGQRLAGFKVLPLPLAQGLQGRKIRLLLLQGGEHLGQFLGGQVPGAGQAHLVQHPLRQGGKLRIAQAAPHGGYAPGSAGLLQPAEECLRILFRGRPFLPAPNGLGAQVQPLPGVHAVAADQLPQAGQARRAQGNAPMGLMYRRAQAGGVALGFAGQQGHLGGQLRGQGLPDHQRQGRLGIPTGLLGSFAADQLLNGRGQGGKPHIPQGVLRGRSRKARHERHAFRGRSHGRKGGQLQGIRHQNQQGDARRAVLRGLLGNQRLGGGLSHGSVRLRGCRFRGLGGSFCRDGILRCVRGRGRGGCLRRRLVPGGSGCLGRNRFFAGGFGLGGCFCRD